MSLTHHNMLVIGNRRWQTSHGRSLLAARPLAIDIALDRMNGLVCSVPLAAARPGRVGAGPHRFGEADRMRRDRRERLDVVAASWTIGNEGSGCGSPGCL